MGESSLPLSLAHSQGLIVISNGQPQLDP